MNVTKKEIFLDFENVNKSAYYRTKARTPENLSFHLVNYKTKQQNKHIFFYFSGKLTGKIFF